MSFSLSQLETSIGNWIHTTEQDIQTWVAHAQADIALAEQYIAWGLEWIAKESPVAIQALQGAVALASIIPGLQIPASVAAGVTTSIALLQSVQASVNANASTPATLVNAYNAYLGVKAANTSVLQTMTSVPTPVVRPPVTSTSPAA